MTWAGLKKCMPTTSWGRLVITAHSMTGNEEVVVARIAPRNAVLVGELAPLDRLLQALGDGNLHNVNLGLRARNVGDLIPGPGEDLDDPGRHRAGTYDTNGLHGPQPTLVDAALGGRLGVGDDLRAAGLVVGVEAAAGLAALEPAGDHLLDDRARRLQPVTSLLVHRV